MSPKHEAPPVVPASIPDVDCVYRIDPETGAITDVDTFIPHRPHLDIKPGKCPNKIKVHAGSDGDCDDCGEAELDEHGAPMVATLRMSILGNAFDVTQVDLDTIGLTRFDPIAPDGESVTTYPVLKPVRMEYKDVGTPFEGTEFCGCHTLQGDCKLDLVLKFVRSDVIDCFGLADEPDGASIQLRVTARTEGDRGFRITDCVKIDQQ